MQPSNATPATTPANVRKIGLVCPLDEGTTAVQTLVTNVWFPDVEGLEKLAGDEAELATILVEQVTPEGKEPYKRSRGICQEHRNLLQKLGVQAYSLHSREERRRERERTDARAAVAKLLAKRHEAPIADILAGKPTEENGKPVNASAIREAVAGEGESTGGNGASQPTEDPEPASDEPKQTARPRPRNARNRRPK